MGQACTCSPEPLQNLGPHGYASLKVVLIRVLILTMCSAGVLPWDGGGEKFHLPMSLWSPCVFSGDCEDCPYMMSAD